MKAPEFQERQYIYKAEVIRVIDGDTMDVRIDVGFDTHIYKRLRLLGVDTWEIRGEERERGLEAKYFVESRLKISRNSIWVQTIMDGEGKYGRLLAWVWTDTVLGPQNLNEALLENNHGTAVD